jgi:hypothetical protein
MVAEDCDGKQVQKMKEMGANGRRMGVWIRTLGSIPCLSSPASSSPSGTVLRAHTACSTFPGADKWAQVLLISQHWTVKWWCNDTKTESPRTPYAPRPVVSGIVVMITSGPTIPIEQ